MRLPANAPPWMPIAVRELGVSEKNAPDKIKQYARDAYIPNYTSVTIPWCSVYACAMLERAGVRSARSAWARDNLKWGVKIVEPRYGCVAVFRRGRNGEFGHVGFFLRTVGDDFIEIWNGNVNDEVRITRMPRTALMGYRWPSEVQSALTPKPVEAAHEQASLPAPVHGAISDTTAAVHQEHTKVPSTQEGGPSHYEIRTRLKARGSRTIHGVDRIIGHVRAALSAVGITGVAGLVGLDSTALLITLCVVVGAVALAVAYEACGVEEARVDDAINGQQARG